MYSVLPALVSALFLAYGVYVVAEKGFNRISTSFFVLCFTTFCWQAAWAVLFQVRDEQTAGWLVRIGYLLILFLPTSLYQFLVEISHHDEERRWVWLSYGIAGVLGVFDLATNLFVNGYFEYFFGYYPRAGVLHPLHVLQTVVVVNRGLYITWQAARGAPTHQRMRMRLCIASLLVYFFAAVDYLCNYGWEFYPPGVVFVAISLGLMAVAVTRYDIMGPVAVAATVAHEMRTPLASIRMQADAMAQLLPDLLTGYQAAVDGGLVQPGTVPPQKLLDLSRGIRRQVDRSNTVIDMMLASARMEQIDTSTFEWHSMQSCVTEALDTYPFAPRERERVTADMRADFSFYGSNTLMVYVLFNLIKNSLYAMKAAGKGEISIRMATGDAGPIVAFTDTASGIHVAALPRIFDTFFTTKKSSGAGIGLAFCRRAIQSFGGQMYCESVEGEYTTFMMTFPSEGGPAAIGR